MRENSLNALTKEILVELIVDLQEQNRALMKAIEALT